MQITKKRLRQIIREEVESSTNPFSRYVLFSSPSCSACVRLDTELDKAYPGHDIKKVDPTKHAFTGWSRIKDLPGEYERNIVVPTLASKSGLRYQFEAGGADAIIDYFNDLFMKSI